MPNTFASRRSANRRRRDEARQQIVEVARRELKAKPFRELTVDELMEDTGLSRTAFYRYFPDRESVLVDLLEEAWVALAEARDNRRTDGTTEPSSLAPLAQLLGEHRGVLKAISDAASGDGDMERTYRGFMQSYWIDYLTSRLVDAQAHGRAAGLDPHLGGEALAWMAERMVTQSLDRDPGQVLDTIVTILVRCIYGGAIDTPTLGSYCAIAMTDTPIDPSVAPSGTGCVECLEAGGWWLHLRRCAQCGHIGCCDNSPSQHATAHAGSAGHPVIRSFEPGEDWFWDYRSDQFMAGPPLAPPQHHPLDQPVPGPEGRVPADWQRRLR